MSNKEADFGTVGLAIGLTIFAVLCIILWKWKVKAWWYRGKEVVQNNPEMIAAGKKGLQVAGSAVKQSAKKGKELAKEQHEKRQKRRNDS